MMKQQSRKSCSSLVHPKGRLGTVVRETEKVIYQFRFCPVCHLPQGIARTVKDH